jgi:hypothetical protein
MYSHFCSILTLGAFSRNPQQPILNLPAAAAAAVVYGDDRRLNASRLGLAYKVVLFATEGSIVNRASRQADDLSRSVMLVQYRRIQFCISRTTRHARPVRGTRRRDRTKRCCFSEDGMTMSEHSCHARSLALALCLCLSLSLSEIFA